MGHQTGFKRLHSAFFARSVSTPLQLRQTATKTKELFRARPIGQCGRRRRCLHGLCHGSQWPWLTSPVLSASPAVARARGPLNHLHLLVTSGSANNCAAFLCVHSSSWPCPHYSEAMAARSPVSAVRLSPQQPKGTPRTSCGRAKRTKGWHLVKAPTGDGGVQATCMMAVGPQCGGCVCGRCVCDVHAWMPCRLGYG